MKRCSKCGVEKELSEFHKNKSRKDGLNAWCKNCRHTYSMANRENTKARSEKWAKNNKKRLYKTKKEWVANNPEKVRKNKKRWVKSNPDKIAEGGRQWRNNNPEKVLAHNAVNNAVTAGILPHISTQICKDSGVQAEVYHHYLGYEPEHRLDVIPLSRKCHGARHRSNPAAQLTSLVPLQ